MWQNFRAKSSSMGAHEKSPVAKYVLKSIGAVSNISEHSQPSAISSLVIMSKNASMLHKKNNEMKNWNTKWGDMNNSVKWSWFEVPVEVKQINDNLFSDTTKSK